MALVGDIIMGFRELATDLPQVLSAPGSEITVTAVAGNGTLAAGTYYFKLTYRNNWGETTPTTEATVVLAANQVLQVNGTMIQGATAVVIYFGTTTGAENQRTVITTTPNTVIGVGEGSAVPTRNSAYLPDTDGSAVSVMAAYRWLNDALRIGSRLAGGGIMDMTGVTTSNGQPRYTIPGTWTKIDSAWLDGYPLGLAARKDVYRRSAVIGGYGITDVNLYADHLDLEIYPQPFRTAGSTTTTAALAVNGTSVGLSISNFLLAFGLAQIGTEIVNFQSNNGLLLSGLIRGVGGTVAQQWPSGTSVSELNFMVSGYRMPITRSVGDANKSMDIPPAWESALHLYMLSRFRKAEQDLQQAETLLTEFSALMDSMRTNRQVAGPRQIPIRGLGSVEVASGFGSKFGGVIIP